MAAVLPAIAGIASALTAGATKARSKKKTARKPRAAAKNTAVVLYDSAFAAKQARRVGPRRRLAAVTVPSGHNGLGFRPTGLQSAAFIGRSTFKPCGPANTFADVSADGSLKIRGRGLIGRNGIASVTNGQIIAANNVNSANAIGAASSIVSNAFIGPGALDPRLLNIAAIYGYYAIRKLDLQYVPNVSQYNYIQGTAPNAAGNGALLSLGLSDQADVVSAGPPSSVQQIADMPCSATGPAYQPLTLQYSHQGSRVYYTSSLGNPSDANESYQLSIAGLWAANSPTGTTPTTVGQLHGDWEVDFYRPMYVQASISDEKRTCQLPQLDAEGVTMAALDVKSAADVKAPTLVRHNPVADTVSNVGRAPTSPTHSLVERIAKVVTGPRYTNPSERAASAASQSVSGVGR